ncbi:hypothetical protein [Ferruginibacter sp.]|uniref:hypothetical protein n=1 Tax=Ferruginibacter sp. TaxID=1940288 RepID=UPI0026596127|nr:hypothetical protein [Ferruginibacter sp.]
MVNVAPLLGEKVVFEEIMIGHDIVAKPVANAVEDVPLIVNIPLPLIEVPLAILVNDLHIAPPLGTEG